MARGVLFLRLAMDQSMILTKKLLDACSVRHSVLAHNLANATTPGFKRSEVDFKKSLVDALKAGNTDKLASAKAEIKIDRNAAPDEKGNTVSTQTEMALMSDNTMLYSLSARIISDKFQRLQKAIKG